MIVKVRKIGNSAGILLSKGMIEQCHIKEEVDIEIKDDTIVIRPVKSKPREGWTEKFLAGGSQKDNQKLMDEFENTFDRDEWTWD